MPCHFRDCAIFGLMLLLMTASVHAHPVSYTDAWVKVSDVVEVRLNVFLDDVLRHQLDLPEDQTTVDADIFRAALKQHAATLQTQLRIFDQNGHRLRSTVRSVPEWDDGSSDDGARDVNLSADSSLKLSWQIEYAREDDDQPLAALCFVHNFTHRDLTEPGELRLHLQHQPSRRRFDSVIPPNRPHTVVFPNTSQQLNYSAFNSASSRLVITPVAIVHEFTAPLSLLGAVSESEAVVNALAHSDEAADDSTLDKSTATELQQQVAAWMRANVRLTVDGQTQDCSDVQLQLVPPGSTMEDDLVAAESSGSERDVLPVLGTLAAIRMLYRPSVSVQDVELSFQKRPGAFDEWNVEIITDAAQTAQNLPFVEGGEQSAAVSWSAEPVDAQKSVAAESAVELERPDQWKPVSSEQHRPGIRGAVVGFLTTTAIFGMVFCNRRVLSRRLAMLLFVVGLVTGGVCLATMPDRVDVVDQAETRALADHLLEQVYTAVLKQDEHKALDRLSEVLDAGLAEQVFLDTRETLSATSSEALLVSLESVEIDQLEAVEFDQRPDLINVQATWRVRGTVYHWGHNHVRQLVLCGNIALKRVEGNWKISSIVQTQPARFEAVTTEAAGV
ncbi:hypothetical protein [Fuerstiella marisgermanici]|uniref:DUF4440 domain-containing protein n=1 Tax=Fuerstiella marisgermanici TaxID=1891926 RepID=A0A1P8WRV4_9PLAN|nr:hypothetical protein [Fuerstiella marisgermanici]APZ96796.1 hypothetical protein Fuma_06470 [Fuerstiella marisgermanici]